MWQAQCSGNWLVQSRVPILTAHVLRASKEGLQRRPYLDQLAGADACCLLRTVDPSFCLLFACLWTHRSVC